MTAADGLPALCSASRLRGDRVAILSTNCTEYFDCYYGVPMAGMALTILNFRLHSDQIAALIEHSGATVLIVAAEFAGTIEQIRDRIPSVHTVVSIGTAPGTLGWDEFVGDGPAPAPSVRPAPDDIAWLVYTSGTTGMPKGVMISHRSLVSGITSSALQWHCRRTRSFYSASRCATSAGT